MGRSAGAFMRHPELFVHTHCQQKSVASSASLNESLSIHVMTKLRNTSGVAVWRFIGYEKVLFEYQTDREIVLFPAVRSSWKIR
jgi:hypothetical protein